MGATLSDKVRRVRYNRRFRFAFFFGTINGYRAGLHGTGTFLNLRIRERLPSKLSAVNKIGWRASNNRPGTSCGGVEGVVGFRPASDLPKIYLKSPLLSLWFEGCSSTTKLGPCPLPGSGDPDRFSRRDMWTDQMTIRLTSVNLLHKGWTGRPSSTAPHKA